MGSVENPQAAADTDAEPEVGLDSEVHSGCADSYEVLGIRPSATLDDARAAYRRLMKEHHHDRVAGLGEELRELAEEQAKKINKAYEDVCAILQ